MSSSDNDFKLNFSLLHNNVRSLRRNLENLQVHLLDELNTVQSNMDKKLYTRGIFIDLKKAFNTVNHSVLLSKLHHYGIRGVVNDWFSSYLSGRVQTTEVEMTVSSKATTPCGVPQGSVLGPLLFLIYHQLKSTGT